MSRRVIMVLAILLAAFDTANVRSEPAPRALANAADIPGNSLITIARALRRDALKNLSAVSRAKYQCRKPRLLDTVNEEVDGELLLDAAGRLMSGVVHERWQIDACGKIINLKVVLSADGKGGSLVAIGELAK
jgi:hypothetical protein